jgi:hypothetical protein
MNYAGTAILTGALLFGAACKKIDEAVSTTPQSGVVALFDISASTDQAALKERYRTEFLHVLHTLAPQGVLIRADAIRATPLAETTFPIRIYVPKMTVINRNEMDLEDAVKMANTEAAQGLAKLFSQGPPTQQTRILDAIEVAARVFQGEEMKGIPDRRLVIFSDMIESSERYEFTRMTLSREAIPQLIARERKARRIPKLDGVRVWVAGAGAGGGSGLPGERLRWIEEFWLEYFRAAGADLNPTRYGSALLSFTPAR